ncbi:energy-coupling factor transporter ATPase [Alkalicoccobacillus porphyridii]|uniref:Energy-coupling factor transporter ATPase n=1 Tax=Alkalicoccobacillus porphyridii TaxID=2597270 RepID=A0A553ZTP8_9BACI|nr:energy-coupling factor transporter ATPase [Alkalicoccobacillus porphyridii]TSB44848.1 energy-coupling factor transporter ATPase [Alkalicoccobacillus porphyridii]
MLLNMKDVSFTYNQTTAPVLTNVSLTLSKGEWVAVAGQNGSGKSTLAKLLSGQLLPSSGSLTLDGEALGQLELRRRCGYVFQNPDHQFVGATIWDDLAFGLENYTVSREDMLEKINTYATLFDLQDLLDKAPHQLSGGQKQRAALAGMMVLEPEVIILDEATSMLDPKGREDVWQALQLVRKQGVTIVMITHDMEEACLADRLVVIHQGSIKVDGRPADVFDLRELMQETALTPPFSVEIQHGLADEGLLLKDRCHNEEELVEQLCNYHLTT